MSEMNLFEDYEIPIVRIPVDRGYWLVRTNAGDYFDDFYSGEYIGIGWNDFNTPSDFVHSAKQATQERIEEIHDDVQSWRVFGQIQKFFHGIKIGDIVMIPSRNSKDIVFGEVLSDVYFETINHDELEEGVCPFEKRRTVRWIKKADRTTLDPYLYKMMQSHFSISDAREYADIIDRTLHGFYIKGDKSHLILNVDQPNDIPLLDLMDALRVPLVAVDLINEISEGEIKYDKEDLDAKIRVQSVGMIVLSSVGPAMGLVIGIGILMVFVAGGKVKISRKGTEGSDSAADFESDGLIEKFIKWKDQSHRQKLENDAIHGDEKTFSRYMELQENLIRAQQNVKLGLPEELNAIIEKPEDETATTSESEHEQKEQYLEQDEQEIDKN